MSKIVYWRQRNGVLVSIDDMDINHLRNTLKMIIRNRKDYCDHCGYVINPEEGLPHTATCSKKSPKKPIKFELKGDMAQEFNNSHFEDLDDVQWDDGEFYK